MLGKGSNSHGSGASISCVGATNSVTFYDARLIDSENAIDVSSQKIVINGIEYEMAEGEGMPTDIFAFQNEPLPQFPPPIGYEWAYAYTIKNISYQDKRLEFVTEPDNQSLYKTVMANNPTAIVFSENRFGVCLSSTVEDLQSCNFGQITIENMLIWNGVSSSAPLLKSWFKLENIETGEIIAFKECNGTNDDALFAVAFEDFLMQINASIKLSAELIPNEWAGGVNRFILTNISANNLQLRFSATIGNEGGLIVVDGEGVVSEEFNPSSYDRYKRVLFCLTPQANTVSCAGATSKIVLEQAPMFDGVINWSMEFDGVSYTLGAVEGGDIIRAMPSEISGKIYTDWDGLWVLENTDSVPHRFKLIPTPKPEFDPRQATWSNNLSFMVNEDGSFVFCLAPSLMQVYPPFAALKTTAAWGTTIPATIIVNGNEYTGSLVNELAAILDQQYHVNTIFDEIEPSFPDGPNAVRIVFRGTELTENLSIYIEFLSEIDVIVDDSGLYPPNNTLEVIDGFKVQFNLGKNDGI